MLHCCAPNCQATKICSIRSRIITVHYLICTNTLGSCRLMSQRSVLHRTTSRSPQKDTCVIVFRSLFLCLANLFSISQTSSLPTSLQISDTLHCLTVCFPEHYHFSNGPLPQVSMMILFQMGKLYRLQIQ